MTDAVLLDALTVTVVVDNATDTLSSITPGLPQLPEMAYLLGAPSIGQHDGHECVVTLDRLCVACHGFSALAEARRGDRTATVLFDVGPYGDVWLANAERRHRRPVPLALALGPLRRHPHRRQGDRRSPRQIFGGVGCWSRVPHCCVCQTTRLRSQADGQGPSMRLIELLTHFDAALDWDVDDMLIDDERDQPPASWTTSD